MNGAQAMVKCLENEGVEMVFGYPGVAICPFYDSLLDTDIKSVLIRTEQNAAHAASGLARVTGKVEHRVGDGPSEEIPVGTSMKVDTAIASYVLSWLDPNDQQPETAYLAKREFEHYVEVGALEVSV